MGTSNEQAFSYDEARTYNIVLTTTNTNGCQDELEEGIVASPSPKPALDNINICVGESAVLRPENGTLFYFYDDPSLNSPIHKGTVYQTSVLQTSQSFYITGVDSLFESEVHEVQIIIEGINASFNLEQDTFLLDEAREILIENLSSNAVSWEWLLDGIIYSTDENPILSLDIPGSHDLSLVAKNAIGCISITNKSFVILNVTGLEEVTSIYSKPTIYPNPVQGELFILSKKIRGQEAAYEVLNHLGQIILNRKEVSKSETARLDISQLPSGSYFLRINLGGSIFYNKIIKR